MLPFFWYMLKVMICSGILFAYYWLFLRNKIFHHYNRFYLLASLVLSLLLPLLKINFWQPSDQANHAIRVLQAVSVGDEYMSNMVISTQQSNWSFTSFYTMIYWLVCLIFLLVMLRTLLLIRTLLKQYPVQQLEDIAFVNTQHASTPFSFLKYIFWNSHIDMETTTGHQIFKHELAHIQQKHTHDKLFVNIMLIFYWCNPFFWLYRKELNMIHEFIADKKAVEDSDTAAFAAMILQAAYPKQQFALVNNFFYSPIKRRLLMLTKNKNPKVNYIGRIMVLPLLVLVFAAFSFKKNSDTSVYHGKKITVVIDAGHGGTDAGAAGANGILEKDLTLAIAKKVKELNSNDAVEIVLVRDGDVYMNPQQKVEFAKSKNADLFISFHIDNWPKESANKHTGMSVWVANDQFSNTAKSKVLASAILNEFSNNYGLPVMLPLNQRQQGVYVLQSNSCPAVLIEAGFINNEKDLAYLQTSSAKETIARNILAAIEKFASTNNITKNASQKEVIVSSSNPVLKDTVPSRVITGINPKAGEPLYIVNGIETDKVNTLYFKPEEIETIRVIKEDMALGIYGEKGKNGVVIINTKPGLGLQKNDWSSGTLKIYDSSTNSLGFNPLIIVDGKEYIGKTLNEINALSNYKQYRIFALYSPEKAIQIYGKKANDGAILVATKKPDNETFDKSGNELNIAYETPKLYFGKNGGGIINSDYLKSIKAINISEGYSFVSCVIWIKGPGFDKSVVSVSLNSTSLLNVQNYFNRCKDGAEIFVDDVRYIDKNGIRQTLLSPPSFRVYDKNTEKENAPAYELLKREKIFTEVEQNPQFTGGPEAWRKFLQANLKVNTPVDNGAKAGIYKVVLKFIVNIDGSLSDIKCENDPGYGICAEAIRFIKTTPKWQPAVQNGKKVNAYSKQPIIFVVDDAAGTFKTEIFKVPLKVHMMNENEVKTYQMLGNGEFAVSPGVLYYVNGKVTDNPVSISKLDVIYMESYDPGSGKKFFGEKGKHGVLLLKTKS